PWTALLAVAALAVAAAELALPDAMGHTLDATLAGGPAARWLAASVGLVATIAAGEALTDLASGAGGARAAARLRHALVRRVVGLDLRAADRHRDGDLVSRIAPPVAGAGQAGPAAVLCAVALVPPLGSLV